MPTDLAAELAEIDARWRPAPSHPGARVVTNLARNEFLDPRERDERTTQAVSRMLQHAGESVPFHHERFRAAGLLDARVAVFEALRRLPPLTKAALQAAGTALHARRLPEGVKAIGISRTSGTTGEPTTVVQANTSLRMFSVLKHRELRWFRFDPSRTLAAIRPHTELPQGTGHAGTLDDPIRRQGWPYLDGLVRTGAFVGLHNTRGIGEQVAFLRREQPGYLIMQSAGLEHVALEAGGPIPGLAACQAISQTLTPSMRALIATALGVRVHLNYGLNEIGLVASWCDEGDRYHVHAEHCHVEIVDGEGRPARPGERGRMLITSLNNFAMPLLRYDADDLAIAVEGACPCGRTLPSFGPVVGRYRRIACLPDGTWARWAAILQALYDLPPDLRAALRRYQARQHADGRWELRVEATGDAADAIGAFVAPLFAAAAPPPIPALGVVATDRFEGDGRGKFQSFVSDFVPPADGPDAPMARGVR